MASMASAHLTLKPVPQVALEVMMKRNREQSDKLLKDAQALLEENRTIASEMRAILSNPPSSNMAHAATVPAATVTQPPQSQPDPMGGLLHAADALVRSWERRHKKNFKQLELDLMRALKRISG